MKSFISVLGLLLLLNTTPVQAENPKVTMVTSMGSITLELYPEKAPKTVANFLSYVKNKFYDNTIFHRVISNFMIQGGGFTADFQKKPTATTVMNEADNGLKNDRGTIAMARTNDPHSATAQFFINVKNNGFLNFQSRTPLGWGYTVFGKVIKGMDTVDKIRWSKTGAKGPFRQDVPQQTIIIKQVTLISPKPKI